jgi:hypothetical protein
MSLSLSSIHFPLFPLHPTSLSSSPSSSAAVSRRGGSLGYNMSGIDWLSGGWSRGGKDLRSVLESRERKDDKGRRRSLFTHQKKERRRERDEKQTEEGGRKKKKMENLCWLKKKKKSGTDFDKAQQKLVLRFPFF